MGTFALLGAFECKRMGSVSTPNLSEIRCSEKCWSGFLCGVYQKWGQHLPSSAFLFSLRNFTNF